MKKSCKLLILALLHILPSFAQYKKDREKKQVKHFSIQPHIGISWQSTLFKPVLDFSPISELSLTMKPINYEKSTQGFGWDMGSSFLWELHGRRSLGVRANARLRYDYVYETMSGSPLYDKEVKAFLCDLNAAFLYTYKNRQEREWIGEIGFTLNQVGRKYYFDLTRQGLGDHVPVNYQYPSLNLGLGYDVLRLSKAVVLTTALTFNYIPEGHPAYPGRDFMTLGLNARFRFKPEALSWRLRQQ